MIPYGRQDVTQDDIDSVVEVLKSDFLTQGPVVPAFETSIQKYCSVNYAIASNSATSSLHAACFALDVSWRYCMDCFNTLLRAQTVQYIVAQVLILLILIQLLHLSIASLEKIIKSKET